MSSTPMTDGLRAVYAQAIRERDEARAELAKVKESAAWHERNAKFFSAALTHMTAERDEALAELAKVNREKYPFVHLRFDVSEAEVESALRAKLIELGWTPPADLPAPSAAPAASEPKVVCDAWPACECNCWGLDPKERGCAEDGAGPKP